MRWELISPAWVVPHFNHLLVKGLVHFGWFIAQPLEVYHPVLLFMASTNAMCSYLSCKRKRWVTLHTWLESEQALQLLSKQIYHWMMSALTPGWTWLLIDDLSIKREEDVTIRLLKVKQLNWCSFKQACNKCCPWPNWGPTQDLENALNNRGPTHCTCSANMEGRHCLQLHPFSQLFIISYSANFLLVY